MVSARSFLFGFTNSNRESFVVEIYHHRMRINRQKHTMNFYKKNRGALEVAADGFEVINSNNENSNAVEQWLIDDTPYSYDDLWDEEEQCLKLQVIQHSDVMYIFSEVHPIMMLKHIIDSDGDRWLLEELELKGGPFLEMNTSDTYVFCTDKEGEVSLKASDKIFAPTDVGRLIRLSIFDDEISPWAANTEVSKGKVMYSDKKYYEALAAGTTGNVKPVHSEGSRSDGGICWKYLHDGSGVVKITQYVDAVEVKGMVLQRLPEAIIKGTVCWEMGMFYPGGCYPKAGVFYKNRFALLVNSAKGTRVCLSASGDYNNFADKEFGEATAETAIIVPVLGTTFNEGKWLYAGDVLFVGTSSGEYYIDTLSASSALASDNVKILQISSVGSKSLPPVGVGSHVFFVDRYGLSIRDIVYNYYNDGYDPIDISFLGKHLFTARIAAMTYQETPDKMLWCLLTDGTLTAVTFSAEQEVAAMSRHDVGGVIESITVIPDIETCSDELWLKVKRTGVNKDIRMLERMDNGMPLALPARLYVGNDYAEQEKKADEYMRIESRYLDSMVVYERHEGDRRVEMGGLKHLEGMTVSVFADGQMQQPQVVVDGKIAIKSYFDKVVAGLPYTSQYVSSSFYLNSEMDCGIGGRQRVDHLLLMLYRSGGGKIGEKGGMLSDILYRDTDSAMGESVGLFSGNKVVLFNGATNVEDDAVEIMIENSSPLPMNILALVPTFESDGV